MVREIGGTLRSTARWDGRWQVGLVVFVLTAGGCSLFADEDPGETPGGESTEFDALDWPLDEYRYTASELHDVQLALHRGTRACIDRFGGPFTRPDPAGVDWSYYAAGTGLLRYGAIDAESAATDGYGEGNEVIRGRSGGGWNPSEEELLLVRGTDGASPLDAEGRPLPEGGCEGEAFRALFEPEPELAYIDADPSLAQFSVPWMDDAVLYIWSISAYLADEDERVQEAFARWSACMDRQGFSFATPLEASNNEWPEPVGDEEIRVAVADAGCKQDVGLVEI